VLSPATTTTLERLIEARREPPEVLKAAVRMQIQPTQGAPR
jgi:hypothetical protein